MLVVGAGPAGSAAAAWCARAGLDTMVVDAAEFPRDKTCGDGLTPRAIGELQRLGLQDWVLGRTRNQGLRAHGFGQTLHLRWPGGSLPDWGSAVPRTELDNHLRDVAIASGAKAIDGAKAVDVRLSGERVEAVVFRSATGTFEVACQRLVVADGVRSGLGKKLGRQWHRDTVYAVAGRSYVTSERADDPWISSHLELRDEAGKIVNGYGWIFPLGAAGNGGEGTRAGEVNLGAGTLTTAKRPVDLAIKPLMQTYADGLRESFGLVGELREPTSALLPMGGAVSGVAGRNWALIGDAAACINPLNGEGIDYGLETGRLVADVLAGGAGAAGTSTGGTGDLAVVWPAVLRTHYGEAFSIARRLGGLVTVPRLLPTLGPVGMRSEWAMRLALRWMGNFVTDEDRDAAARVWRWAGRRSIALDARPPFT